MEQDERKQAPTGPPRIILRVPDATKFREQYLADFQQGRLFLRTSQALAEGTEVELQLLPPGFTEPLSIPAVVVRVAGEQTGFGLRFQRLTPALKARISVLLASFQPIGAGLSPGPGGPAGGGLSPGPGSNGPVRWDPARSQGLLAEREHELETARRALGDRERELDEARSESSGLRILLAEAEGTLEATQGALAGVEQDELQSRALAEKLALQVSRLEKQRKKDQEEAAGQLGGVRAAAQAGVAQLAAERERSELQAAELAAALQAKTEAAARLDAERQRSLAQELRAGELQRELDAAAATLAAARLSSTEAREQLVGERTRSAAAAQLASRELSSFREQLAGARAQGAAAADELLALREQLAGARAQGAAAADELLALREQLAEERAGNAEAQQLISRELQLLREQLAGERAGSTAAALELSEERARGARVAAQLEEALARCVRLADKEQDLRKLLELVTSTADDGLPVEPAAPAGGAGAPAAGAPGPAESAPRLAEELFDAQPLAAAPQPLTMESFAAEPFDSAPFDAVAVEIDEELPLEPSASGLLAPGFFDDEQPSREPAASELLAPGFFDEAEGGSADPFAAPDSAGSPFAAPPPVEAPQLVPEQPDSLFASLGEEWPQPADFPEERPAAPAAPAAPAPAALDLATFDRRFRGGETLRRTARFNNFTPVESVEVRVSTWLEDADSFEQLRKLAGGRLPDDRLSRVVFDFLQRGLVELAG